MRIHSGLVSMGSPAAAVENLVVIGSGPAGYTAALYAARANLSPVLITGYQDGGIPGGQLMTTTHVENFPGFPDGILGPELMDRMKSQAVRWGTRLIEADAEALDLSERPYKIQVDGQTVVANSVILATGASANRLHIDGEDTYWSRGISACAICDGATPQFRKAEPAVVGGGDSACEEALFLTRFCSKVTLVHRRDTLRASKIMAERTLAHEKIEVVWNANPEAVLADESGNARALKVKKTDSGDSLEIPCKGVFIAIGHLPNTDFVEGLLDRDDNGYIIPASGSQVRTSLPGLFAAGDCVDHVYRQAITAAGMGCQSAIEVERWLAEL